MNPMQRLATGTYYTHSGRFTAHGVLLGGMLGVAVAAILSPIYAYLVFYNPFIYVTFLATMGFGLVVGLGAGFGVHAGKVRNKMLAGVLGIGAASVAIYASWVFWVHAMLGANDIDAWTVGPISLIATMIEINAVGAWNIRGWVPTGEVLWGIWALEALLISGFAVYTSAGYIDEPFCEAEDAWSVQHFEKLPLGVVENVEALKLRLQAGDIAALRELESGSFHFSQLSLWCAPSGEVGFLSLDDAVVQEKKNGEAEVKNKPLIKHMIVTGEALAAVLAIPDAMIAEAEAAEAAETEDATTTPDEHVERLSSVG